MNLQVRTPFKTRIRFREVKPEPRQSCFVVYYDGGFASLAALRAACMNAKPDTLLIAVYLDMVPISQAPEEDGDCPTAAQAILAAAVVNARMYGVSIQTTSLECHVRGPALVHLAERYSNATIYLGIDNDEPNPFADYVQAMAPSGLVLVPV